jgi:hypothetical protein
LTLSRINLLGGIVLEARGLRQGRQKEKQTAAERILNIHSALDRVVQRRGMAE